MLVYTEESSGNETRQFLQDQQKDGYALKIYTQVREFDIS